MIRSRSVAAALAIWMVVPGVPVAAAPATTESDDITVLIAEIAEAQQRLHDVTAVIQARREAVNKAVTEVITARQMAETSRAQADSAASSLREAEAAVNAAGRRFDRFAAATYVYGPGSAWLSPGGPADALHTVALARTLTISVTQAATALHRARTDKANHDSAARAARERSAQLLDVAHQRQADAVRSLTEAEREFAARRTEIDDLARRRDSAVRKLSARSSVATIRDSPVPWLSGAPAGADPAAVVDTLLTMAAGSTRATAEMGRAFLAELGLPTNGATGINNGRLPRTVGRRTSEYVIARAVSQRGVSYSWGGGTAVGPSPGIDSGADTVGFDCSGLIMYAFAGVGIALPHYSGFQYQAGGKIPVAQMRRGDVLFYGPGGDQHVALFLGDGLMLEAPSPGEVVRVSPVRTSGMTPYAVRFIEF